MTNNLCTVCCRPYNEDLSITLRCGFTCMVCGRSGFCKICARPQNHDCVKQTITVECLCGYVATFGGWEFECPDCGRTYQTTNENIVQTGRPKIQQPEQLTSRNTRRNIRMAKAARANMRITKRNKSPMYY